MQRKGIKLERNIYRKQVRELRLEILAPRLRKFFHMYTLVELVSRYITHVIIKYKSEGCRIQEREKIRLSGKNKT